MKDKDSRFTLRPHTRDGKTGEAVKDEDSVEKRLLRKYDRVQKRVRGFGIKYGRR